eukprot:5900044-Amphidinium_carterae.1
MKVSVTIYVCSAEEDFKLRGPARKWPRCTTKHPEWFVLARPKGLKRSSTIHYQEFFLGEEHNMT